MAGVDFEPEPSATSYYERLGVSRSASAETISEAGTRAKSRYHPDRHSEDVTEQWERIRSAEAVLQDEADREAYDTMLDRFGPDAGTEAFETWDARSRPAPPEQWEPDDPDGDDDRTAVGAGTDGDERTDSGDPGTGTATGTTSATRGPDAGGTAASAGSTAAGRAGTAGDSAATTGATGGPASADTTRATTGDVGAAGTGDSTARTTGATTGDVGTAGTRRTAEESDAPDGEGRSLLARALPWGVYCGLYLVVAGLLLLGSDIVAAASLQPVAQRVSRLVALSWYDSVGTVAAVFAGSTLLSLVPGAVVLRVRPRHLYDIEGMVRAKPARMVGLGLVTLGALAGVTAAALRVVPVETLAAGSLSLPGGTVERVAAVAGLVVASLAVLWLGVLLALSYASLGLILGGVCNRPLGSRSQRTALVGGSFVLSVLTVVGVSPLLLALTWGGTLSTRYG